MKKVAVILVSYNTRDLLRRALLALTPDPAVAEIVVVDNASDDGSAAMVASEFPKALLIVSPENIGFGRANNLGLDAATAPLALLLNSDAAPKGDAIARLARAFEDPRVVAAGGRLEHPDGTLQLSSAHELTLWAVFCEQTFLERVFPRSRLFSAYWNSAHLPEGGDVEQVMGACLMLRREAARFDPRFFLYVEDTELCRRLRRQGRILYVPGASFVHELGASTSTNRWWSVAMYNRGKELYFAIHHGQMASAACWLLNRMGALLRLIAWTALSLLTLGKTRGQMVLFARVLSAPLKGPATPPRKPPGPPSEPPAF